MVAGKGFFRIGMLHNVKRLTEGTPRFGTLVLFRLAPLVFLIFTITQSSVGRDGQMA